MDIIPARIQLYVVHLSEIGCSLITPHIVRYKKNENLQGQRVDQRLGNIGKERDAVYHINRCKCLKIPELVSLKNRGGMIMSHSNKSHHRKVVGLIG